MSLSFFKYISIVFKKISYVYFHHSQHFHFFSFLISTERQSENIKCEAAYVAVTEGVLLYYSARCCFFFQCALVPSFLFRQKHDGCFEKLQTETRYEATSKRALQVHPHAFLISHRHISQLTSRRHMKHLLLHSYFWHCVTVIFSSSSFSCLSIFFHSSPTSIFGCFWQ